MMAPKGRLAALLVAAFCLCSTLAAAADVIAVSGEAHLQELVKAHPFLAVEVISSRQACLCFCHVAWIAGPQLADGS
jgi:hypothetical protein